MIDLEPGKTLDELIAELAAFKQRYAGTDRTNVQEIRLFSAPPYIELVTNSMMIAEANGTWTSRIWNGTIVKPREQWDGTKIVPTRHD